MMPRTPKTLLAAALLAAALPPLAAQPVVAPANEPTGPSNGRNLDGYNISNWFETGYRFRTVSGNEGKYRSDVNFGNGLRLLGSRLTIHSREGHGRFFDELALSTQGLGNDPYESAFFRIQKNKLYRYDLVWRRNDYFNPGLTVADGQHSMNTTRVLQDHDLTLFPQSGFRLFLGYSRNNQEGPALATTQVFDARGDEFPLFENVRRLHNEYRFGGEVRYRSLTFNVLRSWDNFKEDSLYRLDQPSAGNNPADRTALDRFHRAEPYHGSTPYWRANLRHEGPKWIAASGRFTYSGGRRNFIFDETAAGADRLGASRNRQILISGAARRPVLTGSGTLSLMPGSRWTIASHTAFHSVRMEGDAGYQEYLNGAARLRLLYFNLLGIRTLSSLTDATFRAAKWASLYGGYHYGARRIQSVESDEAGQAAMPSPHEQRNHVHSGLAGLRLQPLAPLRISLDAEMGRADRPIYPISERNYHGLGGRAQWKAKRFQLSAATRTNYNTNSASLAAHSSRSRNYSLDGSLAPADWFSVDAGYTKLHLDTLSAIAYFASSRLVEGEKSLWVSNLHTAYLGARFAIAGRADVYVGFSRVQDAGDGPRTRPQSRVQALPALAVVQTYPLAYQSPLARISVRLHSKLRWNFGYQYYYYEDELFRQLGYRASTGFSSLTWSF